MIEFIGGPFDGLRYNPATLSVSFDPEMKMVPNQRHWKVGGDAERGFLRVVFIGTGWFIGKADYEREADGHWQYVPSSLAAPEPA